MRKNYFKILIVALLAYCTLGTCPDILAQDSTRKAEPIKVPEPTAVTPTPPTSTPTAPAINSSVLTVPPIILSDEPVQPRPRRRKIISDSARLVQLLQDSLKLIAQRDSLAKRDTAHLQNTTSGAIASIVPILTQSDNPFDILRGKTAPDTLNGAQTKIEKKDNATMDSPSLLNRRTYIKNFLFFLFIGTLVVLSFIIAGTGTSVIRNAYNSLMSDTTLLQIFRDSSTKPGGSFAYYALYLLYWISLATFIFLVLEQKGIKFPFGQLSLFGFCLGGVALTYSIKHILLGIIATIFPVTKEVRIYNFIIIVAGILGGLFLLPLNVLIAYSAADLSKIFFYAAIGVLIAMYGFRYLRSLSVTGSFLIANRFHFLLYICAVEIAPVLILIKLILLQMNNFVG